MLRPCAETFPYDSGSRQRPRRSGLRPDGGNGSLEWALPVVLLAISAASAFFARRTYQRTPLRA
jgi:hypothetical protein